MTYVILDLDELKKALESFNIETKIVCGTLEFHIEFFDSIGDADCRPKAIFD